MASGLPKGRMQKRFDFLGGGLVTRPDDRYISLLNDNGHAYSPSESNLQFTKIASIQTRFGYDKNGVDVQGANTSIIYSQNVNGTSRTVTGVDGQFINFCVKYSAPSNQTVEGVQSNFSYASNRPDLITNIKVALYSDNSNTPGMLIASSANTYNDAYELATSSFDNTFFYFSSPQALTMGTNYWFCFQFYCAPGAAAALTTITWRGNQFAIGNVRYGNNGFTGTTLDTAWMPYLFLYTGSMAVLGLYDYRPQAAGVITQFPMVACNGGLYYYNAGYTSIASGLASSVNSLYDFSTLKNLLFSCDYATNNNQVWDGAAVATMTHGYRPVVGIALSASAGGPWSAAGIVKVFLVTSLRSGGYRVSASVSIGLAGTTNKIDLTYAINAVAAQFSFDIAALATTVYCTLPNGAIFYKVPAASLSTAGNPIANTQTVNSILPMTDATLIAGGTFEANLGYPQGYGTGQVDTPKAKFFEVFQNMLASAGDPNNPSRVWLSEQNAPQVWGNGDSGTGIQGDFLNIATDDGETITGLAVSDGALIVGKQNRLYRVDFTGNAVSSWNVTQIHSPVGVLSNWSMQIIPDGLFFLSTRGPAICYGTYADVLPQTRLIQNLFDNTSAASFNLASMIYAVACNDTTRNQVLMTIASNGVTVRDRILTYDYEQKMFALYDGYQANYVASIGDSNGFPVFWTGNLSGQVFKRSSAYFDNGAAIVTSWLSPDMNLGEPNTVNQVEWLQIAGKVQTSGNLYVDFYAANATKPYRTVSLDMTVAQFASGLAVRVGALGKNFSFRIRSIDFTGASGFELHWIRLEYSDAGGTRLG